MPGLITSTADYRIIESTDNAGVALSSFTQEDLEDGKLSYVHNNPGTDFDNFTFSVSDGINELAEQTFNIHIIQSTSTVNNSWEGDQIILYPNPASDFLFIECQSHILKVNIYGIDGRVMPVGFEDAGDGRLSLDVRTLKQGIYLVKLQTEAGISIERVIV